MGGAGCRGSWLGCGKGRAMAGLCWVMLLHAVLGQECGTLYEVPQCREDCGSCGANPCCAIEWQMDSMTPEAVSNTLLSSIGRGGSDGLYELKGHHPNYAFINVDLKDEAPYNLQVVHMPEEYAADDDALAAGRYDDITISIYPLPGGGSRAVAFSRTRTATVFYQCDQGTNYRGLANMMVDAQVSSYKERLLYGCPEKTPGTVPV
mmetsp:Transcript_16710/g.38567  ORF Transcript_16710/g.38567 Transcript_16710/m.38567 type:complete len:206 (+) Transcript_16710:155-772(+)